MLLMPVQGTSTNNRQTTAQTVTAWKAGERLSEETVRQMGIDRLFVVEAISDKTFQRMVGKLHRAALIAEISESGSPQPEGRDCRGRTGLPQAYSP